MTRKNNRSNNEMRSVEIAVGVNKHAEGSALIKFGDTHVICTASIENHVPRWMRGSNEGWITAEYGMLPRSTHERMNRESARGKQSGRTMEIQRLIGRSLRQAVDLKYLKDFGSKNGFEVTGSELHRIKGSKKIFSSTNIREFIKKGKIKEANNFLGHPWAVSGRVIAGDKRGRLIGFPTANIILDQLKIKPGNGVYLISSTLTGIKIYGMMNIGNNPTFDDKIPSIEVHFFDFDKKIYDEKRKIGH